MHIITAESDWISIVIFIVAGIASIIKYAKNGNNSSTESPSSDWTCEEEEEAKDELILSSQNTIIDKKEGDIFLRHPMEELAFNPIVEEKVENENDATKNSLESHEGVEFNLRDAIISSTILKRPDF